ncbi:hypothetical protein EW026_g7639 [Hermanssonia centrifuga]|uniref:Uncharacterized protein n=1 Tax=Hermanssonia centrifuga TaxID=98765 RepID=A0A4S4K763_9APHY|nr:hypothetical protein EW026_g7639 [Hermanssonia centrifuga]
MKRTKNDDTRQSSLLDFSSIRKRVAQLKEKAEAFSKTNKASAIRHSAIPPIPDPDTEPGVIPLHPSAYSEFLIPQIVESLLKDIEEDMDAEEKYSSIFGDTGPGGLQVPSEAFLRRLKRLSQMEDEALLWERENSLTSASTAEDPQLAVPLISTAVADASGSDKLGKPV